MSVHVRLVFPESLVREPILAKLVHEYDVEPNIRRANVEERSGWIVCEIAGDPYGIEHALAWLTETGIRVELLGDVVEG